MNDGSPQNLPPIDTVPVQAIARGPAASGVLAFLLAMPHLSAAYFWVASLYGIVGTAGTACIVMMWKRQQANAPSTLGKD